MAINYAQMRATAKRLLGDNGRMYTITRKGKLERVAGVEQRQPEVTFGCVGVVTQFDPREVDGKTIQTGDLKLICVPENELLVGDLITHNSTLYRVEHPNPVAPGAVIIVNKAVLRAA